jgi:hypothetical protein
MKKKVTLSIESGVYDSFKSYCDKNAVMLSRKIEMWIEDFLDKNKEKKK